MKFHVIGSGAREDSIVWALLKGGHQVTVAPSNPGMVSRGATCYRVGADDIHNQLEVAQDTMADVTIVGPEAPLQQGICDLFREYRVPIVGPSRKAAQLETSKAFSKRFMHRHRIPTAPFAIFDNPAQAKAHIHRSNRPLVVKADGLAAGKGVIVPNSVKKTLTAIDKIMVERAFGSAGDVIVLEERLAGQECSVIVITDGTNAVTLKKAQDHKRRFDNDQGDNTGGMGAKCPVFEDAKLDRTIQEQVIGPTLQGMAREGYPFQGFLYLGLMLTAEGPQVIEYNVRMGDPEASVILPPVTDDLGELLIASTRPNGLAGVTLQQESGYWVCVVLVSDGYPGKYPTGFPITGIKEAEKTCHVFHAGTAMKDRKLVTAGGRVLDVVGWGPTLSTARDKTYRAVEKISFQGASWRKDIASKA